MSIKIIKPGILSTIQDRGRYGHMYHGISVSGALDEYSYQLGNFILNNPCDSASIEVTYGDFSFLSLDVMHICVTGAETEISINNQPSHLNKVITLNQGDIFEIKCPKKAIRNYVCIKGGIDSAIFYNSRSCNVREAIGKKITKDQVIKTFRVDNDNINSIDPSLAPKYENDLITLRVLPTYQFHEFSDNDKALFFSQVYSVSKDFDRTGVRLNGGKMTDVMKGVISEGSAVGSIEITPKGLPIILMRDAPTIGGYPKIGTVFSLDVPYLAQSGYGQRIRFELMKYVEAESERRSFNDLFGIEA